MTENNQDEVDKIQKQIAQVKVDIARAWLKANPQDAGAREALDDAK
eukprot:CAMPEP_0196722554 /NCGR_PEP_ID=MMETSP1091-20130531/4908_1 /TAXON_ID=302021 /ORGANISM="Rhodomonas sp., Strain CCMP768" /LENGTH=45 /DNA_ID= /DNA_START= /DNA_END= /DNA_ORIENTATION=